MSLEDTRASLIKLKVKRDGLQFQLDVLSAKIEMAEAMLKVVEHEEDRSRSPWPHVRPS